MTNSTGALGSSLHDQFICGSLEILTPPDPYLAAMKLAGNHFSLFLGSTVEILFEAIIRSGGGLLWAAENEGNERKWQQILDDIDPGGSETDQTVAMPHGYVWK